MICGKPMLHSLFTYLNYKYINPFYTPPKLSREGRKWMFHVQVSNNCVTPIFVPRTIQACSGLGIHSIHWLHEFQYEYRCTSLTCCWRLPNVENVWGHPRTTQGFLSSALGCKRADLLRLCFVLRCLWRDSRSNSHMCNRGWDNGTSVGLCGQWGLPKLECEMNGL